MIRDEFQYLCPFLFRPFRQQRLEELFQRYFSPAKYEALALFALFAGYFFSRKVREDREV
jgi:hypothetical protein